MKRAIFAAIVIFLAGHAGPGFSLDFDGNALLRDCSALIRGAEGKKLGELDFQNANFCVGYLYGFTDAHEMEFRAKPRKPLYCLPNSVGNEQLARVVVKYLEENPQILHKPMRVSVLTALALAFPCSKN